MIRNMPDLMAAMNMSPPNNRTMPFWYTVPMVISIAANASASANIQFDADSQFLWTGTSYFVDLAAAAMTDATRPIPLINVSLTDTGSGRNFTSANVPIDAIAGYKAAEVYMLPMPKLFSSNATFRVAYTNYSAATTYTNLFMVFHGIKMFNENA